MYKIISILFVMTFALVANDVKIKKNVNLETKKGIKKSEKKVLNLKESKFSAKEYDSILQFKNKIDFDKYSEMILDVKPKNGWHINTGFPLKFKIKGNCKAEKKKYKKKDAKIVTENELKMNMKFKCEKKGVENITISGAFGTCSKDMCKRQSFKFKIKTEVK